MTIKAHLRDKRNEIIWALASQGYNNQDIGAMFNLNRSTVLDIMKKKPKDYKVKWVKAV